MMTIKQLKQLGGSSGKLQILFESGEKFRVSSFLVYDLDLHSEKELTDEEYARFLSAVKKEQTRERAVRIISQTAISESELQSRLVQKGAAQEDAEDAVSWLRELHLTDDLKTAQSLVASAVRKGYGRRRIEQILFEKKIPKELWQQALEMLPPQDDAIERFLHQKLDGRPLDEKLLKKTIDALLRRGHSYSDVRAALTRYRADLDLEETGEDL